MFSLPDLTAPATYCLQMLLEEPGELPLMVLSCWDPDFQHIASMAGNGGADLN